jgi:hydrogenase maturation protease
VTASGDKILVAGIGNIFLGDDAFGVEVVQRLAARPHPPGVRMVDFGIRGLDLTYALLDGYDAAVLIDAAPRGEGSAGTLYVIEPELPDGGAPPPPGELMIETHGMDPVKVLRLVRAMGGRLDRLLLVGCEPTPQAYEEDELPRMSEAVTAAVEQAVPLVESLLTTLLFELAQQGECELAER